MADLYWDPFDVDLDDNPWDAWRRMRDEAPAYRNERHPGTIDITTASLDRPDTYPPTHHSWLSDDVAWVRFGDGLPAFQQSRAA